MDVDENEVLSDEEVEYEDSDNEEKALEQNIVNLENIIAENKYAYQPYLDLINALKSLVDLDRLRHARQRMATHFPLSPDLWIDWLQDEINVATSSEEKEKIIDIFETAVKDYLSVEIWLQYVNFIIDSQTEQNSLDPTQVRKIFERALTAGGLHVTKGSLLWDAYIEYEKTNLNRLQDNPQEFENQLKRIGNLYKRQLSCPLWNIEETFGNYQKWLAEHVLDGSKGVVDKKLVENIYNKTKQKFEKIKPFEESLVLKSEDSLQVYKEYLEHEKSKDGSPVRVQCLYERILCDNCLNEELWLEYIEYVNKILNDPDCVLNVCKRAVRNCPWCCQIYQVYIKCLEKYGQSQKTITEVVEEAFGSGLQRATDFRDIWMTYLEYLRRSFDSPNLTKEEEEKRLEELRTAFAKAIEFLSQLEDADPEYTICQFWARIEAIYCKNLEKSRELWNIIMADEKNKTSEMWLEYIHLERTFGDSKHLRKLFPRALQNTKDWPESVGKAWLNYERDEGTLESYENCLNKIKTRVKQKEEEREREAIALESEKLGNMSNKYKKGTVSKPKEKNRANQNFEEGTRKITGYKRKQTDEKEETSPNKKVRPNENEEEMEGEELTNDQFVKKLLEKNKSHGETVVHDSSKDNKTVFVSNLDFQTEETLIRETFSTCGTITDLRLVRDYKGRSKGYCYVEFENMKEAHCALNKDRELINGRPMFVSKCDPDKETRGSGFKYSSNMEKNKLFVRNLPFHCTADELRDLFSKFGALKDVRLVTYRNGHSKGLAYVEFEDEVSAAQAILKTDGTTIDGKEISVAISNPPGRKTDTALSSKFIPSLGGGPKESGPRGRGRTQISFLPRSQQLDLSNKYTHGFNQNMAFPNLDAEYENQVKLARKLIWKIKDKTDRSIALKYVNIVTGLKSNDPVVKRNRNAFFKYFLQVLENQLTFEAKQIICTCPVENEEALSDPLKYLQKEVLYSGEKVTTHWSKDKRSYVSAKIIPGKGAVLYMAVSSDPDCDWDLRPTQAKK